MNETITNEALDLIVFADDCKCSSEHRDPSNLLCSETVTHLVTMTCGAGGLACKNAAIYAQECISDAEWNCAYCDEPLEDCWKVIPV